MQPPISCAQLKPRLLYDLGIAVSFNNPFEVPGRFAIIFRQCFGAAKIVVQVNQVGLFFLRRSINSLPPPCQPRISLAADHEGVSQRQSAAVSRARRSLRLPDRISINRSDWLIFAGAAPLKIRTTGRKILLMPPQRASSRHGVRCSAATNTSPQLGNCCRIHAQSAAPPAMPDSAP
jgi:hypothetical protein